MAVQLLVQRGWHVSMHIHVLCIVARKSRSGHRVCACHRAACESLWCRRGLREDGDVFDTGRYLTPLVGKEWREAVAVSLSHESHPSRTRVCFRDILRHLKRCLRPPPCLPVHGILGFRSMYWVEVYE